MGRVKKENKKEKNTEEEKGKQKISRSKQGKLNRAAGRRFEAKVRAGLEELGWIVDKWTNTVDYDRNGRTGKLVPAKRRYNPYLKALSIGNGFPDFICIKNKGEEDKSNFEVIGVEVKRNGYLDQIERGMCYWLLENHVFSRILVARAGKKRGEVEYIDFKEKYKK